MLHLYAIPNIACPTCESNTFIIDVSKAPILSPRSPVMLMMNGVTGLVETYFLKCSDCGRQMEETYQIPEKTVTYTFYPDKKLGDDIRD